MGLGAPALNTNQKKEPSGAPFGPGSGRNGLSVDAGGFLVLGNNIGAALAVLLSNREIPSAGFDIRMSGTGNLVLGSNAGIGGKLQVIGTAAGVQVLVKTPVTQAVAVPIFRITNSLNVPVLEFNADSVGDVLIGVSVGGAITTGAFNTALGYQALQNSTTSNQCVAIGAQALRFQSTGTLNTAVGFFAMGSSNVTGLLNTGIGHGSSSNLATGISNTGVGAGSLAANVTGSRNTGVGANALNGPAGSNDNTAIGEASANMAGAAYAQNVMVGGLCFSNILGGDRNTSVGYGSSRGALAIGLAHGADNVVLGHEALRDLLMGSRNVLIGGDAHISTAVGNDNITIGYNSMFTAAVNNTGLLGNAMTTALSNIFAVGRGDQNMIIGVTAPAVDDGNRLQVNGGISFSDAAAFLHAKVAMTDGAAAALGTLTNAPAAGNPTKWIPFDDNGTIRFIPSW